MDGREERREARLGLLLRRIAEAHRAQLQPWELAVLFRTAQQLDTEGLPPEAAAPPLDEREWRLARSLLRGLREATGVDPRDDARLEELAGRMRAEVERLLPRRRGGGTAGGKGEGEGEGEGGIRAEGEGEEAAWPSYGVLIGRGDSLDRALRGLALYRTLVDGLPCFCNPWWVPAEHGGEHETACAAARRALKAWEEAATGEDVTARPIWRPLAEAPEPGMLVLLADRLGRAAAGWFERDTAGAWWFVTAPAPGEGEGVRWMAVPEVPEGKGG